MAGAGAAGKAELVAGSSAAARGLPSGRLYLWARVPGNRRFPCGEATPGAPGSGRPLPAEVRTNGSGARMPSAGAPESAAHRPLRSGSGSRSPRAVPCPGRPRPIPGPAARQREGWPSVLQMGGGGTKHPDRLANDWRAVERGRGGAENARFESWN